MPVPGETDLEVARAALAGDVAAIRVIDQHFSDVRAALKGVVPDHEIDELVQETRVKILVDGKLASYTGRGPLRAWLRVALLRAGLDRRRRITAVHLDDAAWLALPSDDDPALAALRGSLGPVVRRALEAALAKLDGRERLILRQHLVDGLPAPGRACSRSRARSRRSLPCHRRRTSPRRRLDGHHAATDVDAHRRRNDRALRRHDATDGRALAVVHGVHRVTAFRWLVTIRARVLDDVRARRSPASSRSAATRSRAS